MVCDYFKEVFFLSFKVCFCLLIGFSVFVSVIFRVCFCLFIEGCLLNYVFVVLYHQILVAGDGLSLAVLD